MTKDDRVRFTFRIPEKTFHQLKEEARCMGVSTNALILQILWEWANKQKTA
ncbi:Arc family DNA-binding protein [Anaeromassilibacillus senegalensis]|uniref:Arc family DNA-binding protein n=1 Tax=Anaeromassilibacillus senegalensis TaxID=1673717 RepID=UPI0012B58364